MDVYLCSTCNNPADLICFCNSTTLCVTCIGQHLVGDPKILHKPVALKDKKLRMLVSSSLSTLNTKESEILSEASASMALEKACKARIQEELNSITTFCEKSVKKIQNFTSALKLEIDEISSELQDKVKNACEAYKQSLSSDLSLIETLKLQNSLETIEKFELTTSIFNLSELNLRKLLNESLCFELNLQTNLSSSIPSYSLVSKSLSDISQSLDSSYWKRTRTRVPTKANKKPLNSFLFMADTNKVMIYNFLTKELDSLPLEINKESVCTLTNDGSLVITGGQSLKSVFIYDPTEKKIDQVADMSIVRTQHSAVSLGDFVYVIGGRSTEGVTKTCERFDIIEKSWQRIGDLNQPREKHSACVYRGRIFVAGGCGTDTLEVFNTVSNKFSVLRTALSIPGPCLMFPVEDFMIIFHANVVSSFDPAKFTCQNLLSLECSDWYVNGNVGVNKKVASFMKDGRVFQYDVENGEVVIVK